MVRTPTGHCPVRREDLIETIEAGLGETATDLLAGFIDQFRAALDALHAEGWWPLRDPPHNRGEIEWAMLVSNQRPLPCEGTRLVCENPGIPGFPLVSRRSGLTVTARQ
jgi:hypothetical protein